MSGAPWPSVDEALEFLDLEHIDGDLYRGRPGIWPADRAAIFGGETAAQALRAAVQVVRFEDLCRRPATLQVARFFAEWNEVPGVAVVVIVILAVLIATPALQVFLRQVVDISGLAVSGDRCHRAAIERT